MKDSLRTLFVGLAVCIYFLAIGMVGIQAANKPLAEASAHSIENSTVAAQTESGIQVHFAPTESGATSLIRLKISPFVLKVPAVLEGALAQSVRQVVYCSQELPIQFRVRQIIFPFHSFW